MSNATISVAEEEKFGRVNIYWRLEGIRDDYFKYLAHLEMMDYLSKGVSSPIQKVCPSKTSSVWSLSVKCVTCVR